MNKVEHHISCLLLILCVVISRVTNEPYSPSLVLMILWLDYLLLKDVYKGVTRRK